MVSAVHLNKFDAVCVIAAFKWFFIDPLSQYSCCVDSLDRDSLLFSFYCYFARNVQPQGDCPCCDNFLRAFIIGNEPRNSFFQREDNYDKQKQKDKMAEANQPITLYELLNTIVENRRIKEGLGESPVSKR
jgi:hypothetical protein